MKPDKDIMVINQCFEILEPIPFTLGQILYKSNLDGGENCAFLNANLVMF